MSIEETLMKALLSPSGLRLAFATNAEAKRWRMRAYNVRRRAQRTAQVVGLASGEFDALVLCVEGAEVLIHHDIDLAPTITPMGEET